MAFYFKLNKWVPFCLALLALLLGGGLFWYWPSSTLCKYFLWIFSLCRLALPSIEFGLVGPIKSNNYKLDYCFQLHFFSATATCICISEYSLWTIHMWPSQSMTASIFPRFALSYRIIYIYCVVTDWIESFSDNHFNIYPYFFNKIWSKN